MEDVKQAYAKLGLPENASKEEVEKRYSLLLRQSRSRTQTTGNGETTADEFSQVTAAYKRILEAEDQKFKQAFNEKEYGKFKNMASAAEKTDHFWRYYKYHVFGGIVAIALIIYGVIAYMDHREEQRYLASLPPVDLSVMYFGEFFTEDNKQDMAVLEQSLLDKFPEWKRFKVNLTYVPLDAKDAVDMASQQKAMVVLATEKPDIYILDSASFDWISPQGVLQNIDDAVSGELKSSVTESELVKKTTKDEPTEHVYGIDISKSPLVKNLSVLTPKNYIVGVRVNSENTDKAIQFIDKFLQAK